MTKNEIENTYDQNDKYANIQEQKTFSLSHRHTHIYIFLRSKGSKIVNDC